MWKLAVAFVVIAAAVLLVLMKADHFDMGGEKHGTEVPHTAEPSDKAPGAAVLPPAEAQRK